MKLKRFDEEVDKSEMTMALSLPEVYTNLEECKESLKKELESQYGRERLVPMTAKELKELADHKFKVEDAPNETCCCEEKETK